MSGLGELDRSRLSTAISAADAVWDRVVFDHARSFGGSEIGNALVVTGAITARLLDVEYAAIVSAGGSPLAPSGDSNLDESLQQARHEALNTFSGGLLGPVPVGGTLVYGLPILLESPIPVGAVLLANAAPITETQERSLREFLRHVDTRMTAAEHIYSLRKEMTDLGHAVADAEPPSETKPTSRVRVELTVPADFERYADEFAAKIPGLDLFGIDLPSIHYGEFCRNLVTVTDAYLTILDEAGSLFLDVPNAIDAKSEAKEASPYRRLMESARLLRPAVSHVLEVSADELMPHFLQRDAPTFADLTRVAKTRSDDRNIATILDIMNDQGEDEELDALYARRHPLEFRAANLGEVFALIAVHRTLMLHMPERLESVKPTLLEALTKYQAARAYLFAYEQLSDVPLQGEKRYTLKNAQALVFRRRNAPSFELLLRAYQGRG